MYFADFLVLGIILGAFLFYNINKFLVSSKIKRTIAKAKKAEREAIYLLQNNGYTIVSIQPQKKIITYINGRDHPGYVKADFLVKKQGKKYIVEVKTGQQVRATQALVRRQLLEYFLVYNPHGVLLINMETKRIQTIEFDWSIERFSWKSLIIIGLVGFILGIMLWKLII